VVVWRFYRQRQLTKMQYARARWLFLVAFFPIAYAGWLALSGVHHDEQSRIHPYGSRLTSPLYGSVRQFSWTYSFREPVQGVWNAISYHETWQDAEPNLELLGEQLTRLKKERPKNQNEHRLQQQKIQNLSLAIMQLVKDSRDEQYLRAEQEWLLSSAQLSATLDLPQEPRQKLDQSQAGVVMANWSRYVDRRELVDISDLRLMVNIGKIFEASGDREIALKCYELFVSKLRGTVADSTDVGVRVKGGLEGSFDQLETIFEGAIRRLQLIGNKMALEGKTFQGQSFQLSDYEGRVVLVDYWATWCGPCVAEYPQIRKLYDKYHGRGFDVVGVSMDADRDSLASYLKEKEVPWVVLNDADAGGKHPSTEYYNIQTVPAMFLIGRDGKVISTTVEVAQLDALLDELLK
jgi:thiol-disulfide isomerase/thioredoxin